VLNGIFLDLWKEKFFLDSFTYFFPKILAREWALTIGAIEHVFKFFKREFHWEYFIFYKFVDVMSRS